MPQFFESLKDALGIARDNEDEGTFIDVDDPDTESEESEAAPARMNPFAKSTPAQQKDQNTANLTVTAQLQVVLVIPEKFNDAKGIADLLNNKKTVVLNLQSTTPDVKRRIIDFLGGVAYANGGSVKPVANNTFIITPYNVGFQGNELAAGLAENGVLL